MSVWTCKPASWPGPSLMKIENKNLYGKPAIAKLTETLGKEPSGSGSGQDKMVILMSPLTFDVIVLYLIAVVPEERKAKRGTGCSWRWWLAWHQGSFGSCNQDFPFRSTEMERFAQYHKSQPRRVATRYFCETTELFPESWILQIATSGRFTPSSRSLRRGHYSSGFFIRPIFGK